VTTTLNELFRLGMDRELPPVKTRAGLALNLGAGNKHISGVISLDLPEWDAEREAIPAHTASISTVYALHFLEHLSNPIAMLEEIQRVLVTGGLANIVVPYYSSAMQAHDLTHKSSFTEDTWRNLFDNPYYERGDWKFQVNLNVIIGVVERNLALITQLEKI
jgi:hypothetical protein